MQHRQHHPATYSNIHPRRNNKASYGGICINNNSTAIYHHIGISIGYRATTPVGGVFPCVVGSTGPGVFKFYNKDVAVVAIYYTAELITVPA